MWRAILDRLDSLEEAVYAAIAYRDVFDFPPNAAEIHEYLPYHKCTRQEVLDALDSKRLTSEHICSDGEYFALRGRQHCFATRRRRKIAADRLWRRAVRFGRMLATVPFVKMIAVSGSLAAENPGDDADIDFFVLIEQGHLWRTRFLIRVLRRLDFSIGTRTFCPNSMRTTAAMKIEFETLYIAQELNQMRPIYGYDTYRELMNANDWRREFLPNAESAAGLAARCGPYSNTLRASLEWLLDSKAGQWFEGWSSARKIGQFSAPGHVFNSYSPFAQEYEGLNVTFAQKVESQFLDRLHGEHAHHRMNARRSNRTAAAPGPRG